MRGLHAGCNSLPNGNFFFKRWAILRHYWYTGNDMSVLIVARISVCLLVDRALTLGNLLLQHSNVLLIYSWLPHAKQDVRRGDESTRLNQTDRNTRDRGGGVWCTEQRSWAQKDSPLWHPTFVRIRLLWDRRAKGPIKTRVNWAMIGGAEVKVWDNAEGKRLSTVVGWRQT